MKVRPWAPLAAALLALGPSSCASQSNGHGKLSELSRVDGTVAFCDHKVPERVCTRHHPELVANFKRAGDWCEEHGVPESQCYQCNPDLTFEPLPKLPEGADVASLAKGGVDVADLAPHAVKGKVTVFEFWADWCAACRKVDGHVYKRIAGGDEKIAYRKLEVVDWDSPLGKRWLKDVPALPLIVVHGPDGKRFRALYGADLALLDKAIAEAAPK